MQGQPDPLIGAPEIWLPGGQTVPGGGIAQVKAFATTSGAQLVARLGVTLERGTNHITVLILDSHENSRAVLEIPANLAKHEIRQAVRSAVQMHGGQFAHAFYTGPDMRLREDLQKMTATVFASVQIWDLHGTLPIAEAGGGRRALTSEGERADEQQPFEETEARIDRPESVTVAFSRKAKSAEGQGDFFGGNPMGQAPVRLMLTVPDTDDGRKMVRIGEKLNSDLAKVDRSPDLRRLDLGIRFMRGAEDAFKQVLEESEDKHNAVIEGMNGVGPATAAAAIMLRAYWSGNPNHIAVEYENGGVGTDSPGDAVAMRRSKPSMGNAVTVFAYDHEEATSRTGGGRRAVGDAALRTVWMMKPSNPVYVRGATRNELKFWTGKLVHDAMDETKGEFVKGLAPEDRKKIEALDLSPEEFWQAVRYGDRALVDRLIARGDPAIGKKRDAWRRAGRSVGPFDATLRPAPVQPTMDLGIEGKARRRAGKRVGDSVYVPLTQIDRSVLPDRGSGIGGGLGTPVEWIRDILKQHPELGTADIVVMSPTGRVPEDDDNPPEYFGGGASFRFVWLTPLEAGNPHPVAFRSTIAWRDGRLAAGINRGQLYHRMETMLPDGHPAMPYYEAVTQLEERLGMLNDPAIGSPSAWARKVEAAGPVYANELQAIEDRFAEPLPTFEGGQPFVPLSNSMEEMAGFIDRAVVDGNSEAAKENIDYRNQHVPDRDGTIWPIAQALGRLPPVTEGEGNWGLNNALVIDVDGTPVGVSWSGFHATWDSVQFYAIDPKKPFISESGYRSGFQPVDVRGDLFGSGTLASAARGYFRQMAKEKGGLVIPEKVYEVSPSIRDDGYFIAFEPVLRPQKPAAPTPAVPDATGQMGLPSVGLEQQGMLFSRKQATFAFDPVAQEIAQRYTSAATALPNNRPAIMRAVEALGGWVSGAVNVDFGAGRSRWMDDALAEVGVRNLRYDPFNQAASANFDTVLQATDRPADTVTVANVLNVIYPEPAIVQTVRQVAKLLKPDGVAYFWFHFEPGKKAGPSGRPDSWQWHQRAGWYLPKVLEHFDRAEVIGQNMIVAAGPKDTEGDWSPAAAGQPRFSLKPSDNAYLDAVGNGDASSYEKILDAEAEKAGYVRVFHTTPKQHPERKVLPGDWVSEDNARGWEYQAEYHGADWRDTNHVAKAYVRRSVLSDQETGSRKGQTLVIGGLTWRGDEMVPDVRGVNLSDVVSAEPVVRDGGGNVIPPSVRFGSSDAAIVQPRFSLKPRAYAFTPNGGNPDVSRIGYLSGKHSPKIEARAVERGDIGLLISPADSGRLAAARRYPFFAIDNGAFGKGGFNEGAFTALVNRLDAEGDADRLLFVVAPDVVGNAAATLDQFRTWGPRLRAKGLPVAFVGQDGLEDRFEEIPWDGFDVFFLGGSTEWKLGQFADPDRLARWERLISEAHARGKPIHVGRVNSNVRLTGFAVGIGAATADGTMLARAPDENLSKLEGWLDQINLDGLVYAARHFRELGRLPTAQELYEVAAEVQRFEDLGAYAPALEEINEIRARLLLPPISRPQPQPADDPAQGRLFSRKLPRTRPLAVLEEGARQFANWRDWYQVEKANIEAMFGDYAPLFLRFLAATSTNVNVRQNADLAAKAFRQYMRGEPFIGYLQVVIDNLNRAVRGEALSGDKTEPFDRALAGDESAIAIDRHMMEAIFGPGVDATPARIRKAQDVVRKIAAKHGWTPAQTQAALWAWNIARKGGTPARYRDTVTPPERGLARPGDEGRFREGGDSGLGTPGTQGDLNEPRRKAQAQLDFEFEKAAASLGQDPVQAEAQPELVPQRETGGLPGVGSVVASEIRAGFKQGAVNPIGMIAKTPADRHAIAALFRNPAFEVFRAVFIKNGRVVAVANVSARSPNTTAFFAKGMDFTTYFPLAEQADSYFITHNHPSGDSAPSELDVRNTPRFFHEARTTGGYRGSPPPFAKLKFLGHIVTDHRTHHFIDEHYTVTPITVEPTAPDPILNPLWNERVNSSEQLTKAATKFASPNAAFTVIVTAARGSVRSVVEIDPNSTPEAAETWIREHALKVGGTMAFGYVFTIAEKSVRLAASLVRSGVLDDVIVPPTSLQAHGVQSFGGRQLLPVVGQDDAVGELLTDPAAVPMFSRKTPADHPPLLPDLESFRATFPTSPEIVIDDSGTGPDGRGAYFDSERSRIVVVPTWMPRSRARRRGELLAALHEAGVSFIPTSFWDEHWTALSRTAPGVLRRVARGLRITGPIDSRAQRAILREMVRRSSRFPRFLGPIRLMMAGLGASTTSARVIATMQRALERAADQFEIATPAEFQPEESAQVYADTHGAVWAMRDAIFALDEEGRLESEKALEDALFKKIRDRMRTLAEAGEAASIGTGRSRRKFSPTDPAFLFDLRVYGVPVTSDDQRMHVAYVEEMQARGIASLAESLERNRATYQYLRTNLPEYDASELAQRIRRQQAALDSAEEHRPETYERAMLIRYRLAAMPEARAAHMALADPRIQEWVEIIRRIEASGVTPRRPEDMPPALREAAATAAAIFAHEAADARRAIQEDHDAEVDRAMREINALVNERREQRARQGELDVGIVELLEAVAGDARASGAYFSREIAEEVRARHQAIGRLAVALGRSDPTTLVGQFRDALVGGAVPVIASSIGDANVIRELANASGISQDTVSEILGLIGRSQELRNVIVFLADESDARAEADLLNVIEQIEAARRSAISTGIWAGIAPGSIELAIRARHAGFAVAVPAITRLRGQSVALRRSLAGITNQLSTLATAIAASQRVMQVANAAAAAAAAIPNVVGVAEMVYRTANGEYLAPFIRADGSQQPSVRISPTREYSPEIIRRVMEWRDAAIAAVAAGSNPPHITRGLEIGQAVVVTLIDAHSVGGAIGKTMAPTLMSDAWNRWPTGIRTALSRLVPGIMGRRLAEAFARYARTGKALDRIMDRHHNRRLTRLRAAYDSYQLDPLNPMHRAIFERIYSETAHGLRVFGSTVRPGTPLFTTQLHGAEVTTELLSLLRYDREIFREAQNAVGTEPYGGVRNTLPGGLRLVRPPAPTGDIGFARLPDRRMEQELADALTTLEEEAARTPGARVDLSDFWTTHFEAPLSHILDADRLDLAFPRDPVLARFEVDYARAIRAGAMPPPNSLQDIYDGLATLAGTAIANPAVTIPQRFLAEMDRYARIARSRVSERRAAETAISGSGTFIGESDINEFTSPAAPLIYPSGWYRYGAENDLRDAIERINDRAQVAMLDALRNAAQALEESAARIQQGLGALVDEDLALIRWHTPRWFAGDEIDPGRMSTAVTAIRARANIIRAEIAKLTNTGAAGAGIISQVVRGLFPALLSWPRAMLTNTIGGPVSSLFVFAPIIGRGPAAMLSIGMAAGSALNMGWDLVSGAARMAGFEIPGSTRTEAIEWLETLGLGASYSHADLLQMQDHMLGPGIRKGLVRGLLRVGDVLERRAGRVFGTARGDTLLNRFAAQFVVPMALWRMRVQALRWQARVRAAGATPGITTEPVLTFGAQDSANAPRLREMLTEAGLNPEVFLNQLANGEIDLRRFWLHPGGALFGEAVVDDFNSASRTNRPHPSTFLGLLGWTSATVSRALDLFRSPSDTGRTRRALGAASAGLSIGLTFAVSAYAQAIARRFFNEAQSAAARELAEFLAAPPGDDDDEVTWWNWLRNALARVASAFEVNASPTLLPFEKGWWERPIEDILLELARSPLAGVGLDRMIDGGAFKVPVLGLLVQVLGAGGSAIRGGFNALLGDPVEAKTNFKQAMRDAASVFGEWGRVLYNIAVPNRRQAVHDIRAEANRLGIQYRPPGATAGSALVFTQPTPVRAPLLDAGVRLAQAKTPEAKAAADAEIQRVGQSIYQRAFDRKLNQGGYDDPVEARREADKTGRAAVQSALSAIEPVTRALGRSVTPAEFRKLQASGVLESPGVKLEKQGLAGAARVLSRTQSPLGAPLARMTEAVLSPVKDAASGFPPVKGGAAVAMGLPKLPRGVFRRRRGAGAPRARVRRLRISKPKKVTLARPKKIRLPRRRRRAVRLY
jgi:hypothetical protein